MIMKFEEYVSHNLFPLDKVKQCRYSIAQYFDMKTLQFYFYLSVLIPNKCMESGFVTEEFLNKNRFDCSVTNYIYIYQIDDSDLYFVYYTLQRNISIVNYSTSVTQSELYLNLSTYININRKITINTWLKDNAVSRSQVHRFYQCIKKFLCLHALK